LTAPIKETINAEPSFGYRTVAALLGMNKNTLQRNFRLNGGRSVSDRSVSGRELKPTFPAQKVKMSVERLTCAGPATARKAG